ncbi:MAG: ABC transporter permease [Clostridia bacterium]|nr:ABC transporter permease [Clostridia bacterium]
MSILKNLTIKNLKLNKKRTIVTIIGIMLSVALITTVASIYISGIASLIKFEKAQKGNFHLAYYDIPNDDLTTFKNNRKIDKIFIKQNLGYAKLEDSKNEYKPYAHVESFTKDALENLSVRIVKGRLPENENEIMIPTHLKTNGRIILNVGDTVKLNIGKRIQDGKELTQFDSYDTEKDEQIENTIQKTYKIVGIIERPAANIENFSAPGYTFITYMDKVDTSKNCDLYIRYNLQSLKDKSFINLNDIKYKIDVNEYLIGLETDPLSVSGLGQIGIAAAIVCGIIIFTSVFCIKNSFDISITEKTRQYGMLRSVGATKKQIKKNVFYEAFILGTIGIPLGILLGFIASYVLVLVSNFLLGNSLTEGLKLEFEFSWIAVLVALVLGIVTIYFSARKSAKKASKISPIDAIRNSESIKIKANKVKAPKIINKLFGIGGEISYKNLKRNKRKYRTTVISIVVSVFTFIALSTFVNSAFSTTRTNFDYLDYNISLSADPSENNGLYEKMIETTKLDGIEKYILLRQQGIIVDNPNYSNKYKDLVEDLETDQKYINIRSIGKEAYNEYLDKLGLDYEEYKDKAILFDIKTIEKYNSEKQNIDMIQAREFDYKAGDKISGLKNDGKSNLTVDIGYVAEQKPFTLSRYESSQIIVSDEWYNRNFAEKENLNIYIKTNNTDKTQNEIEDMLKEFDYSLNNSDEDVKNMENLFLLISIFLYGFIIVISLIGITNIFNTITTNMELRRREFASLKSIGMTTKEFNRMIRLESVFMGVKALVFGIPIGIGLSYLLHNSLTGNIISSFELPIGAILISIVAVFTLIACIMKYSISKIDKQNIIETIRNENI